MPVPSSPFWKFRTVDANSLKMLINKQLWFSHPSKFNDPFDSQINLVDYSYEIQQALDNRYFKLFTDLVIHYRYYYEEFLKTRLIYCVNQQKVSFNPFDEVLMWSHYADEHRGICVGLSMNSVKTVLPRSSNFATEREVMYGQQSFQQFMIAQFEQDGFAKFLIRELPHSMIVTHDTFRSTHLLIAGILDLFSFLKAQNWSYENEYRFALDDITGNGIGKLISFDPADLENIIFGLLTPQGDKDTIMHLLAPAEWAHVKVWQAKRGAGIFKLEFEQVK